MRTAAMRLFVSPRQLSRRAASDASLPPTYQKTSTSSVSPISAPRTPSIAWSIICTFVVLSSFLSILAPSTAGGRAHAGLIPGFCGDCQTFSNAIGVCGGSFGSSDIEINGEYVLQQAYSKCICTDVMQKVLWTCAKCELLSGYQSKAPAPQKYQTQCIAWGMTIQEWKAPYTGLVAPGTQTDVSGTNSTSTSSSLSTTLSIAPTSTMSSGGVTTTAGGSGSNGDNNSSATSSSGLPSASSGNSVSGGDDTAGSTSGPNTAAIAISVGIIGIAIVAGVVAVVMMKRRKRRRTPLDLDSLPAQGNFVTLEDKWEKQHPGSPPLPPVPIASAAPIISRGGHRAPYDGHGYTEGSVPGGYDAQYDDYDQYGRHGGRGGGAYDGYGHGQYENQYVDHQHVGYRPGHQQDAYQMQDYSYEHGASNAPGPNEGGGRI